MILSIIIVNYNVRYFLEQCLCSVRKGIQLFPLAGNTEICVVDNHSADGSVEYLQPLFPEVKFIPNGENKGFAKACNEGLMHAGGKYILFLNPDTIIPEDGLSACVSFMDADPLIGAAGVRMIDGSGHFLKESKRGFPSPWAAFCRLCGLAALFPHSAFFASYYAGNLPENKTSPVDILPGAFMMIRKEALHKTGGFDEQFFMYAEDIDLSYRIRKAGYNNYYLPDITIIHFKGESTVHNPQYVRLFYKAMDQFMRKHISAPGPFIFFIKAAVWIRSKIAMLPHLYKTKPRKKQHVFLAGDETTASELIALVPPDKKIVQHLQEADEIIFCEGKNFPFKKIIAAVDESDNSRSYKIHAGGSHSIVGSDSKNRNGEAFSLRQ